MSHDKQLTLKAPKTPQVIDDDPSSDEEPDPTLFTIEEEHRGTIPGSTTATAMALAGQHAIANPVIERSKPRKVKKRTLQLETDHAATQTDSLNSSSSAKK